MCVLRQEESVMDNIKFLLSKENSGDHITLPFRYVFHPHDHETFSSITTMHIPFYTQDFIIRGNILLKDESLSVRTCHRSCMSFFLVLLFLFLLARHLRTVCLPPCVISNQFSIFLLLHFLCWNLQMYLIDHESDM